MNLSAAHGLHIHIDHATPLVAAGLSSALRGRHGITVSDAHDLHPTIPIDILIADLSCVLGWRSRRALQPSRFSTPVPKTIVLSASDREFHVRQALEAGAYGYILLESTLETVTECILSVARGQRFLCETAARRVADSLTNQPLTQRELEILQLIARGDCNKRIARALDIAVGTVKSHIRAIHQKLKATCRTQAVKIADSRGLLRDLPPGTSVYA